MLLLTRYENGMLFTLNVPELCRFIATSRGTNMSSHRSYPKALESSDQLSIGPSKLLVNKRIENLIPMNSVATKQRVYTMREC